MSRDVCVSSKNGMFRSFVLDEKCHPNKFVALPEFLLFSAPGNVRKQRNENSWNLK